MSTFENNRDDLVPQDSNIAGTDIPRPGSPAESIVSIASYVSDDSHRSSYPILDDLTEKDKERLRKYWTRAIQISYTTLMFDFCNDHQHFDEKDLLRDLRAKFYYNIQSHVTETPSCWRNNRFALNVGENWKHPNNCHACRITQHDFDNGFAKEAVMHIRRSLDDGHEVVETLKELWQLCLCFVKPTKFVKSTKTVDLWNAKSDAEKTVFRDGFNLDLVGMITEMQGRTVEDPASRLSNQYLDDIFHFNRDYDFEASYSGLVVILPWQYGVLGGENEHMLQHLLVWNTSGIINKWLHSQNFELPFKNCHNWVVRVQSASELPDDMCSICCLDYEITEGGNIESASQVVPVKLLCGHIFCMDCFKAWIKSAVDQHNKWSCPICRRDPSANVRYQCEKDTLLLFVASLTSHTMDHQKQDYPMTTPHRWASEVVERMTEYLDHFQLEQPPPLADGLEAMTLFCKLIFGTSDDIGRAWGELPGETTGAKLDHLTGSIRWHHIKSLELARDRLAAFLVGDKEAYQQALLKEFYCFTFRISLHILGDHQHWSLFEQLWDSPNAFDVPPPYRGPSWRDDVEWEDVYSDEDRDPAIGYISDEAEQETLPMEEDVTLDQPTLSAPNIDQVAPPVQQDMESPTQRRSWANVFFDHVEESDDLFTESYINPWAENVPGVLEGIQTQSQSNAPVQGSIMPENRYYDLPPFEEDDDEDGASKSSTEIELDKNDQVLLDLFASVVGRSKA